MIHRIKKWAQTGNKTCRTWQLQNKGELVSSVLAYILLFLLLLSLDGSLPWNVFLITLLFLLPIIGFFGFLSSK